MQPASSSVAPRAKQSSRFRPRSPPPRPPARLLFTRAVQLRRPCRRRPPQSRGQGQRGKRADGERTRTPTTTSPPPPPPPPPLFAAGLARQRSCPGPSPAWIGAPPCTPSRHPAWGGGPPPSPPTPPV